MHYKTQYNLYRNGTTTSLEVLYDYQEVDNATEKERLKVVSLKPSGCCSKEDLENIELQCWIETDIRLAYSLINNT